MNVIASEVRRSRSLREVLVTALLAALGTSVPAFAGAQEVPGHASVANVALRTAAAGAVVNETRGGIAPIAGSLAPEAREVDGAGQPGEGLAPARTPLPTAARDLPRGATLTAADIVWVDGSPSTADGDQVGEGWVTRRVISAGELLRPPAVAPPTWVTRGDPVQLLYRVGAVEGRLRGTAMGSAAKGERVLVRIDARRRVEGVVVAPGLVQIQGDIR